MRTNLEPVEHEELVALTQWPEGSQGFYDELDALAALNRLCRKYGRIPQLAAQLEDLWRHPEKLEDHQRSREQHFKLCGWTTSPVLKP